MRLIFGSRKRRSPDSKWLVRLPARAGRLAAGHSSVLSYCGHATSRHSGGGAGDRELNQDAARLDAERQAAGASASPLDSNARPHRTSTKVFVDSTKPFV